MDTWEENGGTFRSSSSRAVARCTSRRLPITLWQSVLDACYAEKKEFPSTSKGGRASQTSRLSDCRPEIGEELREAEIGRYGNAVEIKVHDNQLMHDTEFFLLLGFGYSQSWKQDTETGVSFCGLFRGRSTIFLCWFDGDTLIGDVRCTSAPWDGSLLCRGHRQQMVTSDCAILWDLRHHIACDYKVQGQ